MKLRLLLLMLLLASPVLAEGLAQRDLSAVEVDTSAFPDGGPYLVDAAPERLTLFCFDCADAPILDVLMGRQDDGTEARVRSGETTFADLETICQANDPACRLEGLDVAPAVGWITSYAVGSQTANTAVVLRDGDLLNIRALADTPETARAAAEAALAALLPQVVGD